MPKSMTLQEFGDRELLHLLDNLADNDGWCEVEELADAIGLDHKNPTNCVGSRLGRMRTLGAVERKERVVEGRSRRYWRLTEKGEAIADGRLKAAQRRAVTEARPEELVVLTQTLGESFLGADFGDALLMRRSWMSAQMQRKFYRRNAKR